MEQKCARNKLICMKFVTRSSHLRVFKPFQRLNLSLNMALHFYTHVVLRLHHAQVTQFRQNIFTFLKAPNSLLVV